MHLGATHLGAPHLALESFGPAEPAADRLARIIDRPLTLLIELDGYERADIERARVGSHFPHLEYPHLGYTGGVSTVAANTLKLANRPWLARPDDKARPNQFYRPRIKRTVSLERSMPLSPEEEPRSELQIGAIPVNVAEDAALQEKVTRYSYAGRAARAYIGPADGDFRDDFVKLFGAAITSPARWRSRTVAEYEVADNQYLLAQRAQRVFSGRGGLTGHPTVKGRFQPLSFGYCFNIPGQLIDPDKRIWWLHARASKAVPAARDRGVALTPGALYPSYEALYDATDIAPGSYGLFLGAANLPTLARLGAPPADAGSVRFDIEGDQHPSEGYTNQIGLILYRIYRDFGYVPVHKMVAASFAGLSPHEAGWYLGSDAQPTLEDIADQVLRSVYAWQRTSDSLRFRVARIRRLTEMTPVLTLRTQDVTRWSGPDALTPRWSQPVGYARNWGPLTEADIAGSVSDDMAALLVGEYQTAGLPRGFVLSRHANAVAGEPVVSPFRTREGAQEISDTILDIHDGEKYLDEIEVAGTAFQAAPGTAIAFDYAGGGRAPRTVVVVSQRIEIGGRNRLVVFG